MEFTKGTIVPLILMLFISINGTAQVNPLFQNPPTQDVWAYCNKFNATMGNSTQNSVFKSGIQCLCFDLGQNSMIDTQTFADVMVRLLKEDPATFKNIVDVFKKMSIDFEKKFGKVNGLFAFLHENIHDTTCVDASNQDDKFAIYILSELSSENDIETVVKNYYDEIFDYFIKKYSKEIDKFLIYGSINVFRNRLDIAKCVVRKYCKDGPCIEISDAIRIFQDEIFSFVRDVSRIRDVLNK